MQYKSFQRFVSALCALLLVMSFSLSASGEMGESTNEAEVLYNGGTEASITLYSSAEERLNAMNKVYEADGLALYADYELAQFAVTSLESGATWFSSPYDLAADHADEAIEQAMASLVRLEYYDGDLVKQEMNSYADAAATGQVVVEQMDKGIAFVLTIGSNVESILLPEAAPATSFEVNILDKVSEVQKRKFLQYYKRYDLNEMADSLKDTYLEQYPGLLDGPVYVLRTIGKKDESRLTEYLAEIGYSHQQRNQDMQAAGMVVENEYSAYFEIRVECTIEDGALCVNVPMESIESDAHFTLQKIHLLEYFGAAKQTDEGYIFYPDGSGALIDFSKGKQLNGVTLNDRIYGTDSTLGYDSTKTYRQQLMLPVYGIKNGNAAYLAVIEENEASASLSANSGNTSSSYANVWAAFDYLGVTTVSQTVNRITYTYAQLDDNPLTGSIRQRFFFLDGEKADYNGMASAYRTYLQESGKLNDSTIESEKSPLYLGFLGAVKTQQKWGIIPVTETTVLTSFDDMEQISKELQTEGISDLNVRLFGWANGGMEYTVFDRAKVVKKLGGQKGLVALEEFASENRITLFPDIDFSYIGANSWLDGFVTVRDGAKTLTGAYAMNWTTNTGVNQQEKALLAVRPKAMLKYFEKFSHRYAQTTSGLALGILGQDVHSDFSNQDPSNRVQSQMTTQKILESAAAQYEVLVDSGNAYTYAYAQHIQNLPSTSSALYVEIASVPFLQMVLHGYVSYTGSPINLSGDTQSALLKSVENGEALYFLLTAQNTDELLNTAYCNYYSTNYAVWKEQIVALYKEAELVLEQVSGEHIVKHEYVTPGVCCVTYSNGKSVWVNYNETDYVLGDIIVPANSFACVS